MEWFKIFCDGACINNGLATAKASWSYIVTNKKGAVIGASTGLVPGVQNNNRAELYGFINALKYITTQEGFFEVYVDFELLYLYFHKQCKPKSNKDLFSTIDEMLDKCSPRVTVRKTKSHNRKGGLVGLLNNMVDVIAKKAQMYI